MSVEALLIRNRQTVFVRPRWAAMIALRQAGMTYKGIGRRMRRDHQTVMNGVSRGAALQAADPAFAALVDLVAAAISPAE